MKASTNKRRRDTTYTSKKIIATGILNSAQTRRIAKRKTKRGDRKAMPVRTAEETRHSIASTLEGKSKDHPIQCIPPNTTPTPDIMKKYVTLVMSSFESDE